MKLIKLMGVLLLGGSFALTSCSKCDHDDVKNEVNSGKVKVVEIKTTAEGSQSDPTKQVGDFVKFSFKEGKVVKGDNWDFAVRGRLFVTNGRSKNGKNSGLIFGNGEPERTKAVKVVSLVGNFSDIKSIGGIVGTQWCMDYDYGRGFGGGLSGAIAPAISFESNTRNASGSREPWHLRAGKDGGENIVLRPVIILFQTQDGKVAKMQITKMNRTNKDFDKKEEITYRIKYFYNPDSAVLLDETK